MKHLFFCIILVFSCAISIAQEKSNSLRTSPQVVRMERISDDCYINLDYYDKYPSYERLVDKQNALSGWSKFCRIYGLICAFVGGWDLGAGIVQKDAYVTTIGGICALEGIIVTGVSQSLVKKRDKAREEINRYNEIGFPTAEIKVGGASVTPSIDLLTDNTTRENAIGLGFRISF